LSRRERDGLACGGSESARRNLRVVAVTIDDSAASRKCDVHCASLAADSGTT
jgi:hypothetical protein